MDHKRKIQFTKMQSLGNDFMIVDSMNKDVFLSTKEIHNFSDRHLGVGFDQLLLVKSSIDQKSDFRCFIFNADGSESEQCGNGLRCVAIFLYMKKLTNKKVLNIGIKNRNVSLFILRNQVVCIDMGKPSFEPKEIPILVKKMKMVYSLNIKNKRIFFSAVSIGNPHCVLIVRNISTSPVSLFGKILTKHHFFPNRVNVSFMQILNKKHILLRVYERGVGETYSCGSAACAAVSVGVILGKLDTEVQVQSLTGSLIVNWKGPGYPIYITGPVSYVYDGYIN